MDMTLSSESLINVRADINSRDKSGQTALQSAQHSRNQAIIDLMLESGQNMHTLSPAARPKKSTNTLFDGFLGFKTIRQHG